MNSNLFLCVYTCISYKQGLDSRKTIVIEQKRGIVAKSEEKFQSQVFKMTTDEDMPAYSGFEFTSQKVSKFTAYAIQQHSARSAIVKFNNREAITPIFDFRKIRIELNLIGEAEQYINP